MSMMGGARRTPQNVGQTVARYAEYEGAQKAVSKLIEADIPAREISIVWAGLRAVEMVTGKLGYARAAWSGALNGAMLGLMFGAVYTLVTPAVPIQLLVGCLLVGTAIGMIMQLMSYSLVRRRRDYSSITQPVADHYEIAVAGSHVATARRVLGQTEPSRPAAVPSGPLPPPKYGVRIDDQPAPPAAAAPDATDDAPAPAPAADAAVPPIDRDADQWPGSAAGEHDAGEPAREPESEPRGEEREPRDRA